MFFNLLHFNFVDFLVLGRRLKLMTGVFFNSEASAASAASPHPDHLCHYHGHGHTGPPTMINHNNNVYGNRSMTLDAASLGLVSSKKGRKGALKQRVRKVTSQGMFESAASTRTPMESFGTFGMTTTTLVDDAHFAHISHAFKALTIHNCSFLHHLGYHKGSKNFFYDFKDFQNILPLHRKDGFYSLDSNLTIFFECLIDEYV